MQDSFDSMQRSGMMEEVITVTPDSIILGTGSSLDSLGFVTFISDLEERVSAETGTEHYLILTEIHEANADQTYLTAGALAAYIETITG
jgi:acyl carrier protein